MSSESRDDNFISLKTALSEGKIRLADIEDVLQARLDQELEKPTEEIDGKVVMGLEEALNAIFDIRYPDVPQIKPESFESVMSGMSRKRRWTWVRIPLRVAAAIPLILALFLAYDGLFGQRGLDTLQTPDEQQMYVTARTHEPALLGNGVADGSPRWIVTGDMNELRDFLGYQPSVPPTLLEEWSVYEATASLTSTREILNITYAKKGGEDDIVYNVTTYREDRYTTFEQNQEGVVFITPNGYRVKITENVDTSFCYWDDGKTLYYVTAALTNDEIMAIADEIIEYGG